MGSLRSKLEARTKLRSSSARRKRRRTRLQLEQLEDRRLLAGLITQASYFETWNGGTISSTDVAGIAYHPSGKLYLADSEINELLVFRGDNIFEVSPSGDQVFREIASGNTEPTGITFNEFDGFFYVTNDTSDRLVTRYDHNLNDPLYEFAPEADVPGASDPEGIASDPSTGRLFVADGHNGGTQILTYSLDMANSNPATRAVKFEGVFSVESHLEDVEGIAFHKPSGNLFLIDGNQEIIFEYTTAGILVEEYDLGGFSPSPRTPQGLTFGPTSSTTDHPEALALYIADGGVDNFPDGGVYEALVGPPVNFPPVASAIPDKRIVVGDREAVVDLFAAFTDYEDPDTALTFSVTSVSNPFLIAATSIDAGSGMLSLTAATGAIGSAEITVRATDSGDPGLSADTTFTLTVEPIDPANQGTVQSRVAAHSDDAEEQATGRVLLGSSDLEMSLDGASRQVVGMRFTDLSIPAGAFIQNAYIQFQADEKNSEATTLTIRAQAIDHAPTFRSSIQNISSRVTTNASVDWSPEAWTETGQAGDDQRTADLSAVVQEIVDRPGWWSGNAMAIIITGNGRRVAESFNGSSRAAPLLVVEYSTRVSIGGAPLEDQVLTASNSISSDAIVGEIDYQWRRDGVDIPGAIGPAYLLTQADVGSKIAVVAIYSDGQGTVGSVASADIGPIANVNDDPVGSLLINGVAIEGQTLNAAHTLVDEDGLGTLAYQWKLDGVDIPGATSPSYTLSQSDVGRVLAVTASYTDGSGTEESLTSAATVAVANLNNAPAGSVQINNPTPAEDDLLTVSHSLTDEDGLGSVSYQWQRNHVNIPGATANSYRLVQADVGSVLTVTAGYTDGFGTLESVTSVATAAVTNVNDPPRGEVTIDNLAPAEDDLLSASNTLADEDGMGSVAYQWKRNGVDILGATGSSYRLVQEDVGSVISVTAGYTDAQGTVESVSSVATAVIGNLNDTPTGVVTIDNLTPSQDDVLTASNNLADDDGLGMITYQWKRDGIDIPEATTNRYTLSQADVGGVISVAASYTDGQGTSESVTSPGTAAVSNVNDVPTGSVAIDNLTPAEDDVLTASNTLNDEDGLGEIHYQWKRDEITISGATNPTYTLVQADVGALITVTASYTDGLGTHESLTSPATAPISNLNDVPTGSVTIDNMTPTEDDLLTVSNTLMDEDGLGTIGYQWKRDDVDIPGATNSSYTLRQADVGGVISVTASYSDGQGTLESVTGSATTRVTNRNDSPTGTVTIDNLTPAEDDVLTASNAIADEDGLGQIRYQWQRDEVDIPGATNSSYTLVQADVGAAITVTASYTDGQGTVESVTSAATAMVGNLNDAPTGSITLDPPTPAEDDVLHALNTLADEDGLGTFLYQWHRDGIDIPGANGSTYTVEQIDVGALISVTASYTDGQGTAESVSVTASAPATNVNDDPAGSVTISGEPNQRQTLSAAHTLSDEDGLGTVSYHWQRGGVDIESATGSTYTLTQADTGTMITVVASYTDGQGTFQQVTSDGIGPITPNRVPTGSVTILGTPIEDQTLTVSHTLADEDGLGTISYQWQRNGVDIPGATTDSYTLNQADVGTAIAVIASYTDDLGTDETVTSAATPAVENLNDAPTGSVTIDDLAPAEDDLLTAGNTLADEDGLGTVSYQWQRDGVAIAEGTESSYRLTQSDVGASITVTATYTDGQGTVESVTGVATAAVLNRNDSPDGSVTIDNMAPAEDDVLTATHSLSDEDGLGEVHYQWKRDGVDIPGATSGTYRVAQDDVGTVVSVTASYTDDFGTNESVTSATTTVVTNVNDAPTGNVTIDDSTPAEDDVLTAIHTLADEDGLGPVSYQWQRDGIDIPGATGNSYTVLQSDVGTLITVTASYTDEWGAEESVSSQNDIPVANVNDAPTGSITVSGLLVEHQTLVADLMLSDEDGLGMVGYQWQRDGIDIAGAIGMTYTLSSADIGAAISVVAGYTDGFGTEERVTSPSVGPILPNHVPTGNLSITGLLVEDQTLTVLSTLTDQDGLGDISYQWQRDGVDIPGETGNDYLTTQADVDATIGVVARYTDNQGTEETVVSGGVGPIANVNDSPTGSISITGILSERRTLAVENTLADEDGLGTMAYQWRQNGIDIPGATGPTYTLTADDVGTVISVRASYTDQWGTDESVISAGVGPIPPNHRPTGDVTISSLAASSQTLVASSTLADQDGLGAFSYQWKRDNVNIPGATSNAYRLVQDDVGSLVTVTISYTDGNGNRETVTSNQAEVVTMIDLLARNLREILNNN